MFGGKILRYIIAQYYLSMTFIVTADDSPVFNNINTTSILRYGHHRVNSCPDPNKSYICIMKCLELGFQIAQSNKYCKCTCLKDAVKAKYFVNVTKGWTVPTTSKPAWAAYTFNNSVNVVKLLGLDDEGAVKETPIYYDNTTDPDKVSDAESSISIDKQQLIQNYSKIHQNNSEDSSDVIGPGKDSATEDITIDDNKITHTLGEDANKAATAADDSSISTDNEESLQNDSNINQNNSEDFSDVTVSGGDNTAADISVDDNAIAHTPEENANKAVTAPVDNSISTDEQDDSNINQNKPEDADDVIVSGGDSTTADISVDDNTIAYTPGEDANEAATGAADNSASDAAVGDTTVQNTE